MTRRPLISIIMPAYECGETLPAAIKGVVVQTCEDWELLVIDDGSKADFRQVIEPFDDARIRFIRLAKNGGLAAALNVGLSLARARYIARIDADDVMERWRLTEQLTYLQAEKLAVCGTGARKFGIEGGLIIPPRGGDEVINTFFTGNPFVHPTIMFDRERAGADLRYDSHFSCEEDYELWSRLVTSDNCGNFEPPSIRYRVGLSNNANHPTKRLLNRIALQQFADRMGVRDVPIAALNEFQMTGFVDEPSYRKLRDYAERAELGAAPKLGSLQALLLASSGYAVFLEELLDRQRMSVRMTAAAAYHPW